MIINLVSNLDEDAQLNDIYIFNHTVAWFLREALKKRGVKGRLVRDADLLHSMPPKADHTLVISGTGRHYVAGLHSVGIKLGVDVRGKIQKTSSGKIGMYIDADYSQWFKHFNHIFTVVKPRKTSPKKCVYAGWGADPECFYPDQDERALFLDSYRYGTHKGRFDYVYDIYKEALTETDIKIYNPSPVCNRNLRVPFTEYLNIMRKCHYYCCTQLGESGLTRIEAATCGALLVVPAGLYRPKTMASLEHKIWNTKEELLDILSTDVDVKLNRRRALEHSWDKVAGRVLKVFES